MMLTPATRGMRAACSGAVAVSLALSAATGPAQAAAAPGGWPPRPVTAYVVDASDSPVTLLAAAVVPVPGFAVGKLSYLAVSANLNSGVFLTRPAGLPVTRFYGMTLRPGESRILFGISGWRPGTIYAAAGLRIVYRFRDRVFAMTAWSGNLACVISNQARSAADPRCDSAADQVMAAIRRLAG